MLLLGQPLAVLWFPFSSRPSTRLSSSRDVWIQCSANPNRPLEIIVVDNASEDGTRELLSKLEAGIKVIHNDTNIGFAAAQNQAARSARGSWLLSLNPDVVLRPNFIAEAVSIGELNPKIATVCGKLLRWNPGSDPEFTKVIDSTGIYFQPHLRHLDRGAGEPDRGQFEQAEHVLQQTLDYLKESRQNLYSGSN